MTIEDKEREIANLRQEIMRLNIQLKSQTNTAINLASTNHEATILQLKHENSELSIEVRNFETWYKEFKVKYEQASR